MSNKITDIHELGKEEKNILLINFLKVLPYFAGFYAVVCYAIDFKEGMIVMIINFIIQTINYLCYTKKNISFRTSSNLHLINCLFAVVSCAYFTGGLLSPSTVLIATVPLVSLLLIGTKIDTLIWVIISFLSIIIFTLLFYNGHQFPQNYDPIYEGYYFAICWGGIIFLNYIIGFLFEKAKGKALEVVRTQNFHLNEQQDEINASNEELYQQKEELSATVEVVQDKNKLIEKQSEDVKASILYASRIQNALLPVDKKIKDYFNDEIFILNKPRDIVSGDFYWFEKLDDCAILVTADCTGHGVPGAFMSMLGVTGLNSIVFQEGIFRADKILNHLHDYIYKSLQQKEGKSSDGMDVSVLVIHDTIPIAEYAGAMNSIYCIQNNELQEIKADKKPIGSNHYGKDRNYTKQVIDISKPTVFYTGSDGYQDQFGGEKGRKFMKKSLKKLMLQQHSESFKKQDEVFTSTLENWMKEGDEHQIDDILLMGFKVDRKLNT
ncbi:serine phosphatase RsbU, regulator of sigma subunit [Bernardetia litoralis DSM 6794]|uniref:Serine phosphatase RsbU, regulator of sigma subunit n=1 Tax=Bernardetia litoralis (strain ATCC 23117 / DSM 6794 / NBRC 15988 / NCIMB 1366 / Fx l1 / Sio-4) TaxID=880071 RepID=I4AK58_BERLS|nr:SpoIIE family protein phosphatase [Bernardetia litoralis]AFM04343.1 serine phosphatase RsbU, regulator of sigma subunit [Bernardetia litoralis DSM 6794]